jgi:hypothetical protein
MKNLDRQMDDELRPEYDLQSLRVRKVGSGRKESNRTDITQNNQSCLAEKINEFEQSPSFCIKQQLQALKRSFKICSCNFDELNQWLEYLDDSNNLQILYLAEKIKSFESIIDETARLLENFLASTKSFSEHTYNHFKRLSKRNSTNNEFFKKYLDIYQKLVEDLRMLFLLRNHILHYSIPNLSFDAVLKDGEPEYSYTMKIQLNSLLENQQFKKDLNKEGIKIDEDYLDIQKIINDCYKIIPDFYSKLKEQLEELYKDDLEKLDQIEEEIFSEAKQRYQSKINSINNQ